MRHDQLKFAAAAVGAAVVVAAAIIVANNAPSENQIVAGGGSGDSATGTTYVSTTLKPMSQGSTVVATATSINDFAPSALVTSIASPTYKATPG